MHPCAAIYSYSYGGRGYVVQPGDNLSLIAYRLYGNAGAWRSIYAANAGQIANPNLIFPGQVLAV